MNRALRFLVAILWVALAASAWARPEALLAAGAAVKVRDKTRGPTAADSDGTVAKVTTQVYTGVTINDLRAMHRNFHPREQEPSIG